MPVNELMHVNNSKDYRKYNLKLSFRSIPPPSWGRGLGSGVVSIKI
jgi:hypothetical protein